MIANIADAVTLVHEKGVEIPANQEGTQEKRDNGVQQLEKHIKVEESDPVSTDIEVEAPEESTTVLTAVENLENGISVMNEDMTEEPEKPSTVLELLQVVVDDVEKETKIDGLVTELGVDDTQESTPIRNTKGEEEDVESVYQEEHVSTPAKP
ncbi:unnamed protein product [Orchesella dallaii]|uniref:Uncharacterized protein n=1 Tax=Orchesella dallaii TaxID=48710 RepID=A0ABP1RS10_9HEXA